MNPLVYIIILNWNGKDLTKECVESLLKVEYDNYKILVVDNGSSDGSVGVLLKRFTDIEVLELDDNFGYADGNNAGFRSLKKNKPKYIIFLNNDTLVDANFIEPLIKPLEVNQQNGQTVPKIYYANERNTIWYAGGKVNLWIGKISHIGIRRSDSSKYSHIKKTGYATGCCFAIRYDDFAQYNGFDTTFPMYAEDVDLSLRIRNDGKNVLFIPESKVWHKVSSSLGGEFSFRKFWRKYKGNLILFKKHTYILQRVTIMLSWIILIPFKIVNLLYFLLRR